MKQDLPPYALWGIRLIFIVGIFAILTVSIAIAWDIEDFWRLYMVSFGCFLAGILFGLWVAWEART